MTVHFWLKKSRKQLEASDVGTARLDCLVLLEDVTGVDKAQLLAEPDLELSAGQQAELEKLLKLRARHMPLAYVRGKTEFYGREFVITPAVLEPRPESETMIDCLKELHENSSLNSSHKSKTMNWQIADVGTGSGALGITAALELSHCRCELLEIDLAAIQIAKINVDKFTLGINVVESDLLSNSDRDYDVLLCNLPYVPDDYQINRAALHEPKLAIYGGPDGLDLYRKLFGQIDKLIKQPLYILTESLPPQHTALQTIVEISGYCLVKKDDFILVFSRTN